MAMKALETKRNDVIAVLDDYGGPICIRIEGSEGDSLSLNIDVEEARKLARTLNAFAEIHDKL